LHEWLDALAREFPDEEWLQPVRKEEEVAEPRTWHDLYFRAFDALQYDRFYGAMGGEGPIYYMALSQYARDHAIVGDEWTQFKIFMNALDGEWLAFRREQDEAARRERDSGEPAEQGKR
jgi:hypothetical protein